MSSDILGDQEITDEIRFRKILLDQVSRYPAMEIQDLYKLIQQGVLGSEHAVDDPDRARIWLEEEIANLDAGPEEPVVDNISFNEEIVRINLRPYLLAGGSPGSLLRAFIRTANEYRGSSAEILRCWSYSEKMTREEQLKFEPEQMSRFMAQMAEMEFPALHHSEIYQRRYHPAYRVVAYSFLTGWKQVEG